MKISNITILLVLAVAGYTQAQDKKNAVEFEVLYTFSGEVVKNFDSLYTVTVIIEEKEVKKLERFYIKMGSQLGWSDLFAMAFENEILDKKFYNNSDKEKHLKRKGSTIEIDLGSHPYSDYYIEVNSKDSDGAYIKSKKKED